MSRTNKLRNKRTARAFYTHEVSYDDKGKVILGKRTKGPRTPWGQPGMRSLKGSQ